MAGGLLVVTLRGIAAPSQGNPRVSPGPQPKAIPAPPVASRPADAELKAIKALKATLDQLAGQIDTLDARVEKVEQAAATPPAPPRELTDLRTQVGWLAGTTSELAKLPDEFKRIDGRVTKLLAALDGVRDEVAAVRGRAEQSSPAATPGPAGSSPAAATSAPAGTGVGAAGLDENRALLQGIKLFKQNRYKEALGVFNRLELTNPDDARVWYFAALSHGLATGQWSGGTERLVEKGIERERAGTPSTAVIDAAFSDLTAVQGRDWIAEYRRRGLAKTEESSPSSAPTSTANRTPPSTG
jgi:hypothetical protein